MSYLVKNVKVMGSLLIGKLNIKIIYHFKLGDSVIFLCLLLSTEINPQTNVHVIVLINKKPTD